MAVPTRHVLSQGPVLAAHRKGADDLVFEPQRHEAEGLRRR